ncbi:MAG: repressor LexA [Deltaproteobacteria bacterium]|nr:MAG: repressor LexA [Deltaproteobacteria bacterium]
MKEALTPGQSRVLNFLTEYLREWGYPPTLRDIAGHFNLTGPMAPKRHLEALERKGYIRRVGGGSRAIEILGLSPLRETLPVPVVGRVSAGKPILAEENLEGTMILGRSFVRGEGNFLLRVKGESMIGEGILDGDYALIRPQKTAENGEIVVVLVGGEATLKRFYREKDFICLQPANSQMKPMILKEGDGEVMIIGKVVGVLRMMDRKRKIPFGS